MKNNNKGDAHHYERLITMTNDGDSVIIFQVILSNWLIRPSLDVGCPERIAGRVAACGIKHAIKLQHRKSKNP